MATYYTKYLKGWGMMACKVIHEQYSGADPGFSERGSEYRGDLGSRAPQKL